MLTRRILRIQDLLPYTLYTETFFGGLVCAGGQRDMG